MLTLTWVAPSRERGSKPLVCRARRRGDRSLPHGSADRNRDISEDRALKRLSLPHGSADRNLTFGIGAEVRRRRSLTGARIETSCVTGRSSITSVAPSRERGSKLIQGRSKPLRILWSLPHGSADRNTARRAGCTGASCRSLTGARIETGAHLQRHSACRRRSLTGARIETRWDRWDNPLELVAPSRERGSKHTRAADAGRVVGVAPSRERGSKRRQEQNLRRGLVSLPHGSADRNNRAAECLRGYIHVAPSRERGSKPITLVIPTQACRVAPSRERGSKLIILRQPSCSSGVAPSRERGSKR